MSLEPMNLPQSLAELDAERVAIKKRLSFLMSIRRVMEKHQPTGQAPASTLPFDEHLDDDGHLEDETTTTGKRGKGA